MKVLHVGMGLMPAFARELSKICAYNFLDWTQYVDMNAKDAFKRDLLRIDEKMQPDIILLHIQRPDVIDPDLASKLHGLVVNWTYDVLDPIPDWYYSLGPIIDLTLFCNDDDVDTFREKGFASEYLQIGYDEHVFKPEGKKSDTGEIVFLGNNYHSEMNYPLTDFRLQMVNFLKSNFGESFKVYGNNWPYNDGNFMFKEQKEAECYRGCKIAINVSHFDRRRYTSDRIFRIMGTGAFCLTKWYPDIEKDFTDGLHLRIWKTLDDLKELIKYYTEHEEERRKIARQGMNHVKSTCTWHHRMHQFKNIMKTRLSQEYKSKVVKEAQTQFLKQENIPEVVQTQVVDNIPKALSPDQLLQPNLCEKIFNSKKTNYEALKKSSHLKISITEEVDVSVIIPVRGRINFNQILVDHLKNAFSAMPDKTFSITFVEHSILKEHEKFIVKDVNYIHLPSNNMFNKCLSFNAGVLFSNKAKFYLFHDLDIIMKKDFFVNIFKNYEKNGTALQAFRKRRVLYCNESLTNNILIKNVSVEALYLKYPGLDEPAPSQMRAPGGSIFVARDHFLEVGGYDPELFFGYSIEDQFFYDKLQMTRGISSCDHPDIEVFHLNHPPMWNSNPHLSEHINIYESFNKMDKDSKMNFIKIERDHLSLFLND